MATRTASAGMLPAGPVLQTGFSRTALLGALGSVALFGLMVVWAQVTMINGAVIASGQVVVRGKPKMVQSLDGGVVEAILVENGDVVAAGDLLLRLDPTLLAINLDIYRTRLAEALARKARLEAEQLGLPAPVFGYDTTYLGGLPQTLQHEGQRQIFLARRDVLIGRREQLTEKIGQFRNQITGVKGQIAALQDQLRFIETDLANTRRLTDQGLARGSQLLEQERMRSAMLGQISEQQSGLAGIANSIRDTEMEILQGERQFKEEVVTDLRDVTTQSEELTLQIVTTQKQLDRIELRAPADGIIHELQAATIGGVVAPGAIIVQIVPLSEGVEFELRLETQAVDKVHVGQRARVMLPSFNQRITPEIFGSLTAISPSSITDPATGQSFYRLQLTIPPEELARLGPDADLVPGMPVEAFLQTGERSALAYLTKPLVDQLARAFRED